MHTIVSALLGVDQDFALSRREADSGALVEVEGRESATDLEFEAELGFGALVIGCPRSCLWSESPV